jgi:hypothetical protein
MVSSSIHPLRQRRGAASMPSEAEVGVCISVQLHGCRRLCHRRLPPSGGVCGRALPSIDRSSPACSFDRLGETWERNQIALALMVPTSGIQTGRLKVQRNTACLRVLYDFPLPFSWLDQAKPTRPVVCLVSALGTVPRKSSAWPGLRCCRFLPIQVSMGWDHGSVWFAWQIAKRICCTYHELENSTPSNH